MLAEGVDELGEEICAGAERDVGFGADIGWYKRELRYGSLR